MRPRLALILALLMLLLAAPVAAAPPGPTYGSDRPATRSVSQRWIVQLQEPPLAQAPATAPGYAASVLRPATVGRSPTGRLLLGSQTTLRYRAFLEQRQASMFQVIRKSFPAAQLQRRYQVVFNGMALLLPGASEATIARLRATPGVAAVYADQRYEPTMFSSLPQIGAPALWESKGIGGQGNAGAGMKIAIIDAGIKIDNPFFNPAGFSYPPGYPRGDTAHTSPKVIVARAYFRPDLPPIAGSETPQPGPEDSSHGTHVAGTAAGVGNTSAEIAGVQTTLSGVAPRAYLMNYKTFYSNDSLFSGSSFSVESIAALEDAVADGADVINNSWGGRAGIDPAADPIVAAAEAAVDAGVTVIFSAGNEGPNKSTAGAPGYSDKLLTVGATTTSQTIAAGFLDVVAPPGAPDALKQQRYASAAFGPELDTTVFGPAPYTPVAAVAGSPLACEPLPAGSLAGQVALIARGVCGFSLKVLNAQLGGAVGAIVFNSEAGGEELIVMAPGDEAEQIVIPAVFVARSVGLGMSGWYGQAPGAAQVQLDPRARIVPQTPDVLAPFSSRGPTFQGSLKPDLLAPGVNILSAGFSDGDAGAQHLGFGIVSGTSMAAPHVTGGAALLRQLHPDWSPADIKSALTSTAATEIWLDQGRTSAADVLERGAGRIDLPRAASPGLLFDRPTLSFGSLTPSTSLPTSASLSVSARNITGARQTYTLGAKNTGDPKLEIAVTPASLTLLPGQSAAFQVTITMPAGVAAGDYGGLVELTAANATPLHLPLWARALPAEKGPKVLLLDNDGSSSLELPDYSGYYGNLLIEQGIGFSYLDVDALAGEPQTLPNIGELQRYEIILWFTGDNALDSGGIAPLTANDQDLMIAYLQGGGNLIATGQDLATASDINNSPPDDPRYSRSDLYRSYLGARFVADSAFPPEIAPEHRATGTAAQPWLSGLTLDLSVPSGEDVVVSDKNGAGNQRSVDVVMLDDTDPRTPDIYTTPIFQAVGGGIIGLNQVAEPTLERPARALPYRTTYLAFGLEGVRSDTGTTTRKELLQAILYWTVDRPAVDIEGGSTVQIAAPGQSLSLTASARSNTPTSFVRYRWDFGDGSPILETNQAAITHQYAKAGSYKVRVEATDTWGHRAVSP